jgi:hypothetical protein
MGAIRKFETGATRDGDKRKPDYDGFLSPLALEAFGQYMHFNRHMADGSLRDSDNWQKGIPIKAYVKSLWRHFLDTWRYFRGYPTAEGPVWALCGVIFNAQGLLHELLKEHPQKLWDDLKRAEIKRDFSLATTKTPYTQEPQSWKLPKGTYAQEVRAQFDPHHGEVAPRHHVDEQVGGAHGEANG